MKLKLLLFAFSLIAVFYLGSENANAYCTYSNPLYATMTPLDKVAFQNCLYTSDSYCDGSCGSFNTGCSDTKIMAKDITSCVKGSPFSPCGWLADHFQEGYTYTYKDCLEEPIRNKCYGGACVECLSNTDCTSPKTCNPSSHICESPPVTGCSVPSSYSSSPSACTGAVSGTGASCGYYYCASPKTPSNTCVSSSADCTTPVTSVTCTNPSQYYNEIDCGSGGCQWCGFGSGSCKDLSYSCPSTSVVNKCPAQTSKSLCDQQTGGSTSYACGWCPNSYNGGTSANGGTCMKAQDLAANCGGCYNTGAYNTIGNQCSGKCPVDAGSNGYYGGWCIWARQEGGACDYKFEYATTCSCKGNKFDTTKASDNIVNCGECAINKGGQNCGGTAVITPNEGANVYSGASVSSYSAANYQWCGRASTSCTTTGGYSVRCDTYDIGHRDPITGTSCASNLIDHPNSNEILCGTGVSSGSCGTGCGTPYAVNTCNKGDTCGSNGNYYANSGKCCPAGYPYYNSADSKCYSKYEPPCSDGLDNDKDCLVDCADPDCSLTATCDEIDMPFMRY